MEKEKDILIVNFYVNLVVFGVFELAAIFMICGILAKQYMIPSAIGLLIGLLAMRWTAKNYEGCITNRFQALKNYLDVAINVKEEKTLDEILEDAEEENHIPKID